MNRQWLLAAALALAIPHATLHAQQLRKWIDNGRVIYSDVQPTPTAREAGAVSGTPNGAQAAAARAPAGPSQAGVVEFFTGKVTISHGNGRPVATSVGAKVLEGDAISTAADGELHIDMTDGGLLAVRPNSQIRISQYRANGDAGDASVLSLVYGGLRSITGWIGKSLAPNARIVTPSATIGIRGTDHETYVVLAGAAVGEPGTYEKVYAGETVVQTAQGAVNVRPASNPGFASTSGRDAPRLLSSSPAFLSSARNDARLQGRHDAVMRSYEQKRELRRRAVDQERAKGAPAAPGTPLVSGTNGGTVSEEDLRKAQELLRQTQKAAEERRKAIDDAGK